MKKTIKNKILNKFKTLFTNIYISLIFILTLTTRVYADSLASSKLVTGTKKLLTDGTTALLVILPILAGLCGIYFSIRLSMADEQDKKTWANRLKILGVGFIISITITGLINILASYYQ